MDRVLLLLVVLLAFLSTSFAARNSDFWFHLATGRLLARGQFVFGVDPFAYTTRGVYWVCYSWLFDLGLYEIYGTIGGAGLVVIKALLAAALAGVLLFVRRPDRSILLPAVCTTLAILVVSPRFLLQPVCVSYFLLGLTFWLLWRPHAEKEEGQAKQEQTGRTNAFLFRRPTAVLPVVFALWVNVDEWFLLGPTLTALFWIGERVEGRPRTPNWLVPVGLAACLLNPHAHNVFLTLPSEIAALIGTSALKDDARFQPLFSSVWSIARVPGAIQNPAFLAYVALTALGLLSFCVYPRAIRGWRMIVWLAFAALAVWHARAIPFYAIVAAPITALNWQDFLASRRPTVETNQLRFLGPACSFAVCLSLLALIYSTWAGWALGTGREERRVAWAVQTDPSLQRAAEALEEWRRQRLLSPEEHVFAISPELAHYCTWFSPSEKHFMDHRYPLFRESTNEYEIVCRALLPKQTTAASEDSVPENAPAQDWQRVFHDYGISVVAFSDRDPQMQFAALQRVAQDPEHWTLLDVAGNALIVGWNEARPGGTFAPLAFDADRLAFGSQDDQTRRTLPPAPNDGPERLPPRRNLGGRLAHPPAPPVWQSAAASMYLHYGDDRLASQFRVSTSRYVAGSTGFLALPSSAAQATFQLALGGHLYFAGDNTPALPLLAIRAARQAVAANPEDANAWLRLGQAYVQLRNNSCERSAEALLPPLAQVRDVQIATALEQAVRLDPDLEAGHRELAFLYGERNSLDQSLAHRREEVRLALRAGQRPGESDDDWFDRQDFLERDTAKLAQIVENQRKRFATAARALPGGPVAHAALARRMGLARQALDEILLPTPADLLGEEGIKLQLELLLMLGRLDEVRAILNAEQTRVDRQGLRYFDLPPPTNVKGVRLYSIPYHWRAYEWLHILQSAAVGDYAEAQADLRTIRGGLGLARNQIETQLMRTRDGEWTFVSGLWSGPPPFLPAFMALNLISFAEARTALQKGEPTLRAQQADLLVIEALLNMERGDTASARLAFAAAQSLCSEGSRPAAPFAGEPIAARYLAKLVEMAKRDAHRESSAPDPSASRQ